MIYAILAAILAALAGVFGLMRKGRQIERGKQAEAALKTREKIDDALERSHAGGASWHDRLPPSS